MGRRKRPYELSVGKPNGLLEVGALDGEDVDEDRLNALKQDVERSGVFEDPALFEEVAAEVEGEFGGGEPQGGRPLPGIGGEGDARVVEEQRLRVLLGSSFRRTVLEMR